MACALESPARDATELSPLVVSAARTSEAVTRGSSKLETFPVEALRTSSALTLDGALRQSAGFSLFRRGTSLTTNPTAQGVSLRGLGPSGASRSLVLLDGVPLNDPFGGWIAWSKVPRLTLARAEILRGGGSAAWGNAALSGTVALASNRRMSRGELIYGEAETVATEAAVATSASGNHLQVQARAFSTAGFFTVGPEQRGPIDRRLESEHRLVQASVSRVLAGGVTAAASVRAFEEERGNGTPLQRNASCEFLATASLESDRAPERAWRLTAYAQRQRFESFFSSVNAARAAETPASNQFDVPATAAGAVFTQIIGHAATAARTSFGVDVRAVEGETREDFFFNATAGDFTRRRFAGGAQAFAGVFVGHDHAIGETLRFEAALRADYWRSWDGHRREFARASGASIRDENFATRDGFEMSPRLGVRVSLSKSLTARVSAYRAFRVPTLNELYRPFRVGAVNTEANAALGRETYTGAEAALEWRPPATLFALEIGGFGGQLNDAVGNVTLAPNQRQRLPLERVRARGLEVDARAGGLGGWEARASYLLNDSEIRRVSVQPSLVGRRLAQVPRHTLTLGVGTVSPESWPWRLKFSGALRWASGQYEDDENRLPLASAAVVDLRVARDLAAPRGGGNRGEIFVAMENVFDRDVEAGRSADGVLTLDAPRRVRGGVSWVW
jgi:outer membrane receptor protein involved in Fe transport